MLTAAALLSLAVSLDPMKDSSPREVIAKAFTSKFGLQVHPICFDYVGYASPDVMSVPTPREYAEERLESLIEAAVGKVVVECRASYPELDPYLVEWISSLRRTILTCTKKTTKEADFRAITLSTSASLDDELVGAEREGIRKFGFLDHGSYVKNHKPVVIYPLETIREATMPGSYGNTMAVDTLIHEVLHNTRANNRDDHNEVEVIVPPAKDLKKFCADDISVDRINVVSRLCSGRGLGDEDLHEYLFKRISWCGLDKCTRLFTSDIAETNFSDLFNNRYLPSKALGRDAADALCRKIYVKGGCGYLRKTQKDAVTLNNRVLRDLGRRLSERFAALVPHAPAQLTPELMALGHDVVARLKASTSPACFAAVFDELPGGGLALRRYPLAVADRLDPADRLRQLIIRASSQLDGDGVPGCNDYGAQHDFRWTLWQVHRELDVVFGTDEYKQLIQPRLEGKAETKYRPDYSGPDSATLRKLVGEPLFDAYLSAVRLHHYDSPQFDCSAVIKPMK